MKRNIVCLLLAALSIIILPLLFAQQDQNSQRPDPEIAALKKRILELENKLRTVENVEKMELAAKLADANAKLLNAEIDKFKRELKDTNDEWLRTWSLWFVGIIAIVVTILCAIGASAWSRFKSKTDQLISDEVEKSLDRFKEAVEQVNLLQDQIRILEKEHTASVLEGSVHLIDSRGYSYSETIKALPDGGLLDLIADKTRGLNFRYKAAEVLAVRKNPKLVSPVLELLNLVVDSKVDWDDSYDSALRLCRLVNFLGQLHTQESHEGLAKFLDRLLTEDTELKDLLLTWTVFSLAYVSGELNKGDSVSLLKTAIPYLNVELDEDQALKNLARVFDIFNEPTGIKEILTHHAADRMSEVETQCLELLEKHDPEFVKEWQAQKETSNTQTEESE